MSERARSAPPELSGFTFLRTIGGGGFADVFLYEQQRPVRQVAVKVLRAEHLSDHRMRQFETEADVMAQISEHPYIVTIYTAGAAPDGRPYIVMEHYPQPHFGLRGRSGTLSISEVLRVGVQVSSAVETAHQASILHRDIKPANILTSAFGRPGLTDFGISGVRREGAMDAAAGVTIPFAPPEILVDDHATGSEVSDVYSLAATVYALLTGRPPFWVQGGDNSDGSMIQRTLHQKLPPIGRDDTGALEHLLSAAMAKDPAHRPRSALALAQALQDVEQGLRLAPTAIEARSDAPLVSEPLNRTDDDGTRRPPHVVRPERAGFPATSATPGADARPPAAGASVIGPLIGDSRGRSAVPGTGSPANPRRVETSAFGAATVGRSPGGPLASPVGAIPATPVNEAPPADARRPLIIGGAAAAVLAFAALIGVAITGGSDAQRAEQTTTTMAAPRPDLSPTGIGTPREVRARWDPVSGVLHATWKEPAGATRTPLAYTVLPEDIDANPAFAAAFQPVFKVYGTDATITDLGLAPDEGPPCIKVYAVAENGTPSDPSSLACPPTDPGGSGG